MSRAMPAKGSIKKTVKEETKLAAAVLTETTEDNPFIEDANVAGTAPASKAISRFSDASPKKTQVRPSARASAQVVDDADIDSDEPEDPVPIVTEGIVFTDDEDLPPTKTASEDTHVVREQQDSDAGSEEEPYSADVARQSDIDFIDDSADVGEADNTASESGDGEDSVVNSPTVNVRRARAPVRVRMTDSPVEKVLERMEVEGKMYKAAKKSSVASIAATNPGDGTKCRFGEESYIHDDIIDSPRSTGVRPHVSSPATPTKDKVKLSPFTPTKDKVRTYQSAVKVDNQLKFLSDTEPRGEKGPEHCEIANEDDMDSIINYADLPTLFAGRTLDSWSTTPGPGLAVPSAWHDENPTMSMSQLRNIIQFKHHAHFYNPSRMTPSDMGLAPFPGNSYIVPGGTTRAATLTTAVLVTSSKLYRMKEVFGEERRMISGIPHIGEWQRMESAILMSLHLRSAHAQLAQQAITFSTSRTMSNASTSPAKNPSRMFRQPAGASASGGSPFAGPVSTVQGAGYVPVLDARNTRFSLGDKLTSLDRILPPFNAEVPEGSCAWIGYTVNKYTTTKGDYINFNLLWVVVLGTPE
ncbi:hypothetical protein HWV62_4858 [Athelia sp. TMB]|nr:hypothetical protein HWV62_4858 [Athelia sp. TMB]